MREKIRSIKQTLVLLLVFGAVFASPGVINAQGGDPCSVPGAGSSDLCNPGNSPGTTAGNNPITNNLSVVVDILLTVVGVIAVITIIIGGIQYITSAGDPGRANRARSTIIYSIVAVVVAVLARSIIVFILDRI